MKKSKIYAKAFMVLAFLIGCTGISAQNPPPPPNGGHGISGNKAPGEGAPIGNGTFILLALAAAYGGRKVYNMKAAESQK